jgi:Subtilase family
MARKDRDIPSPRFFPDLQWYLHTRGRHMPPGDWLPLAVQFDPEALRDPENPDVLAINVFNSLQWLPDHLRKAVVVPAIFVRLPKLFAKSPEAKELTYSVVCVQTKSIEALLQEPRWVEVIVRADLGPAVVTPDLEPSGADELRMILTSAPPGAAKTPPAAVLTAVLDDGIAFAHHRFRLPAGTRIAYFLNQDGPSLGTELTAANIKKAMDDARFNGIVDELAVYRAKGGLDFSLDVRKAVAHRRSHGTHVLDLAAGEDPGKAKVERPIVAVQMPARAVEDSTGVSLLPFKIFGLGYALQKAVQLATQFGGKVPVVVNLSFGGQAESHTGRYQLEWWADFLTKVTEKSMTPLYFVIAAGNSRQGRSHAQFELAPGARQTLHWRLQPDDRTPSLLQVWPRNVNANLRIDVQSPDGNAVTIVTGQPWAPFTQGGTFYFGAYSAPGSSFDIRVAPTAPTIPLDISQATVASGVWTVTVINQGGAATTVDAYIQRDNTPPGYRSRGRQSYFEDAQYTAHHNGRPCDFDADAPVVSVVKRRGTLSDSATGERSIVIGGYRRSDNMPARYTAQGPVAAGAARVARSPNLLAPSDDSIACAGVLAAGTSSGSRVPMRGTSAAAPQIARWIADQLAIGNNDPMNPLPPLLSPNPKVPPSERDTVAGYGLMPTPPMLSTGRRP